MKTRVLDIWYRLLSSFWFVPALMVFFAIILWYLMSLVDTLLGERSISLWWIHSGGIEGARSVLSTIAGSVITVAGVVFSITIVVLSQSASQFGPEVIKSFMQDKSTQVSLGTFAATFIYSLLMLGTLRGISGEFQSQAGTTFALILALISIGVLIMFIHSMARAIQSNRIIVTVAGEINGSISRVSSTSPAQDPVQHGKPRKENSIPDNFDSTTRPIIASKSGFLQAINVERLMQIATNNDLILKVRYSPGQFIPWKGEMAAAWPGDRVKETISGHIRKAFIVGDERTTEQDIEYSIERLAMIVVRALSPGINDLYTATICINWLGVVLCQIVELSFPNPHYYDSENRLRVITRPLLFSVFADAAFNEIRHSADSPGIFISLLNSISSVVRCAKKTEHLEILRKHARDIESDINRKLEGSDLQRVREQYLATLKEIDARLA